jgi:hypothetical protein
LEVTLTRNLDRGAAITFEVSRLPLP